MQGKVAPREDAGSSKSDLDPEPDADEWVVRQNQEAHERLKGEYVPAGVAGFFLFDRYATEYRDDLVGGLRAIQRPPRADAPDRLRVDDVPNLQSIGLLRGARSAEIGTLVQMQQGLLTHPEAVDLPPAFEGVILTVRQYSDLAYWVSYGFILADELVDDVREAFLHSEDDVPLDPVPEGAVKAWQRRPLYRGRLEDLEREARKWIASRFRGQWISPQTSDLESPTIVVMRVKEPRNDLDKEWTERRQVFLRAIGVEPWEAAGDGELLIAPTTVPVRGPGTPSRGFHVLVARRSEGRRKRDTDAWVTMHRLRGYPSLMNHRLYSWILGSALVSLDIPPLHDRSTHVTAEVPRAGQQNPLGREALVRLEQTSGRLNALGRDAVAVTQNQAEHLARMDWFDRGHRAPIWRMVYNDLHGEQHFFNLLKEAGLSLHNLGGLEARRIADQAQRDSAYVGNLFSSAATSTNLRLQRHIKGLAIVAAIVGGVAAVAAVVGIFVK